MHAAGSDRPRASFTAAVSRRRSFTSPDVAARAVSPARRRLRASRTPQNCTNVRPQRSAGGYLRSLTERAKDRKFSVWSMIMALLRAKLDGSTPPVPPAHGSGREPAKMADNGGFRASAELQAFS